MPTTVATGCLLALLLLACSGFQQSPPESSWPPDLEGEWRWVETVEGSTGEVHSATDDGSGAILHLEMTEDAAGRYAYLEAGELVAEGGFDVAFEDEMGADFITWRPPFEGFHEQQWLTLSGDTLRLREATAGATTTLWVRVE